MFAFRKQVHGILAILTPISASLHIHGSRWTIPARTEALLMNCLCGTREVQVPVKRKSHPHTGFPWLSATNLSPRALINPDVDREEFHLFSLSALSCRSLADGQWDLWRWQEAGGRKTKVPVPPRVGDRPQPDWPLLSVHVAQGHGWHINTQTHTHTHTHTQQVYLTLC